MVATLHRLRWCPVSPGTTWTTDKGQAVNIEATGGAYLKRLVNESTDAWLGREIAGEVRGPTLRAGVWWEPIRDAVAKATPAGASYLRAVASQTDWTQSRLYYARRVETVMCQKCLDVPGTLQHRHYCCGGLAQLERQTALTHPGLEAFLRPQATRFYETLLFPTPYAAVAPPQADVLLNWVGPKSAERLLSGTVYTDGSTYDPRLSPMARSGCGFAQADDHGRFPGRSMVAAGSTSADDAGSGDRRNHRSGVERRS